MIAHKIQPQEYSRGGDLGGREHTSCACWRNPNGNLYAPYSIFDGDNRKLNQNWLDNDWNDNWSFVAFRDFPREYKSPL